MRKSSVKFFSSSAFNSVRESAASFVLQTWSPSVNEVQNGVEVRRVVTVKEAKAARAIGQNAEVYGHASAEVTINFKHPCISEELLQFLSELAQKNSFDFKEINELHCYISWYPVAGPNARTRTSHEDEIVLKLAKLLETNDTKLKKVRNDMLNFMKNPFKAKNQTSQYDCKKYGEPDQKRLFSFNSVDFKAILDECTQLMQPRVQNGVLLLDKINPEGMYFGLESHLSFISLLRKENNTFPKTTLKPEHICTTAALRLLKAGVGEALYREAVLEAARANPELAQVFSVDLTHVIFQVLHAKIELKPRDPEFPKI